MEYLKQYQILLKKARTDIAAAEALFVAINQDIDNDVVLFHLQQATEKLLKAFLAYTGEHIPKTHDTEQLFDRTKTLEPALVKKYVQLSALDDYAVEGRYGDVGENIEDISLFIKCVKDFEKDIINLLKI